MIALCAGDAVRSRRDTYTIWESVCPQVTERQLESTVGSLEVDLESDLGIGVDGSSRRHDGDVEGEKPLQVFIV